MADFLKAIDKLLFNEGGYVNDPDDRGGETYKGISRKYHKDDAMWDKIDSYKKQYGAGTKAFKNAIDKDEEITNNVRNIYKKEYWDKLGLDDVKRQNVAEELFDDAVNRGVGAVAKLLSMLFGMKKTTKPTDEIKDKIKNI